MADSYPTVCVHGLGYVGLPTAAVLANAGYEVAGFDADPEYRAQLQNGDLDIDEPDLKRFVQRALEDGLTVVEASEQADFHIICVPTPYDEDLDRTDLSYVRATGKTIADVLRPDDTVILSSTVPPETTDKRLKPELEESGLSAADDFVLGYSPETVLPGNILTELRENDRIVGTVEGRSPEHIVELYDSFVSGDIRTCDATTAEFVKLIQNAYRDVNIAFANEVAKLAHEFGIDSRSAIVLANNHPRAEILHPGPGVGGHCIPVDPLFLNYGNNIPTLIETARSVNDGMVGFVKELLTAALDDLSGATITLLGVAYKGGVSDIRRSPSLALAKQLENENVESVRLTDPYVTETANGRKIYLLEEGLDESDAAILVTDHPEYGALAPELFAEQMRGNVIIDTRAILSDERWEQSGFEVYQI